MGSAKKKKKQKRALKFHPLTRERWKDFEKLFGARGACGGCWCMWWRITAKEFEAKKGEGNKKAMRKIVTKGTVPGIIAYHGDDPVGWCSVAPREDFPRLERSKILKPVDDKPVWSVVCLFVAKPYRRGGVSTELLQAAVQYVKKQCGKIVEGYAVEPKKDAMPDAFAFHGLAAAYKKAGFKEVARRSETRPIMRCHV
ncbi:MAG: GNAT family N-acetyltransferase [Planctomycetota bacterium]|jgi:GNAT superfamily N-acetyltransferase